MRVGFITLQVNSLPESERFYCDLLGLEVTRRFPPTCWLSLGVDEGRGAGFGLFESETGNAPGASVLLDIYVDDLDALWPRLAGACRVISEPEQTDWGSYKAVVLDPSGNQIGLVQESS